jgi:hypothetical protein
LEETASASVITTGTGCWIRSSSVFGPAESVICTPLKPPQFLSAALGKLVMGSPKLFTPLGRESGETKDGSSNRISDRSLAPAFEWSLAKGKIFSSNMTSLKI